MNSSIFDIFKIGIGPSSSHTVGPMIIANKFVALLKEQNLLKQTIKIKITLYGSLSLTGIGHSSHKSVLLGMGGHTVHNIDTSIIDDEFQQIQENSKLKLMDGIIIDFDYKNDFIFDNTFLDFHPNAIKLNAYYENNEMISKTYYSIGGGLVLSEDEINMDEEKRKVEVPYPFSSAKELLDLCKKNSFTISQLIMENEKSRYSEDEIKSKLKEIWLVMQQSVIDGCSNEGLMPGHLKVPRRAKKLYDKLSNKDGFSMIDPLEVIDWVDLYALAVNEQNACGGRVVTAPTNGAAGIIPAVIHYMNKFLNRKMNDYDMDCINDFLLTSAAIGMLYQKNASISGADVGCQGEVGVACSMAAGALAYAMGGDIHQVENAAEIGMEHNLGLTCDPIGGYVQIPCIERNAMGAMKAINAARMAMNNTSGEHHVSLDSVIKTMFETGKDMMSKYKETSLGGLAVNAVEC